MTKPAEHPENMPEDQSVENTNENKENILGEIGISALPDITERHQVEIDALKNDLIRERAEFANYRKRMVVEKSELSGYVASNLLKDLLPALDAIDQFFAMLDKKKSEGDSFKGLIEGVQLIQKQIITVFTEAGVQEFSPIGAEFDPSNMEALSMQEADVEKETVSLVFQKGYKLEGKLIRPARVVVTRPVTKHFGKDEEKKEEEQNRLDEKSS